MPHILCFNAGSSSLSFVAYRRQGDTFVHAFDGGVDLSAGDVVLFRPADGPERRLSVPDTSDFPAIACRVLDAVERQLQAPPVVAHRIVHGGDRRAAVTELTQDEMMALDALAPLAPIHQPAGLGPARAIAAARPDLPQVAVFDTAFHATLPDVARRLPLPETDATAGLRRFGFHGLSYAWTARHMREVAPDRRRIVALHLSGGASACAIRDGQSVDTTMGATPLDGLMMGARSGALDPGLILVLMQDRGLSAEAVAEMLWHQSGLAGVSGISNDTRDLLPSGAPEAEAALALFCRRAAKGAAGMAVSLGGLDALVFTGGMGAEQPVIRARICADLEFLGVRLDASSNARNEERISPPDASVEIRAFAEREEWIMALETSKLLGAIA
ncbi:acetate kinase [uncultured Jannaschia sp.]|uniref:acetate/propionate family kinase n=1 Tax=uncultured Jannaschia sp. TaxID=293347 RepID=UPI002604E7A4|nr:acetate kinase [uncultured Jannaschia sp.]